MLCDTCQATITGMWPSRLKQADFKGTDTGFNDWQCLRNTKHPHHGSYEGLLQASEKSCYICYRVVSSLNQCFPGSADESLLATPPQPFSSMYFNYQWWDRAVCITVSVTKTDASTETSQRHLEAYDDLGTFSLHLIPASEPIKSVSSTVTMLSACGGDILQWLDQCQNHHPICSHRKKADWYPTRLLDLSEKDTNGTIKLVETKQQLPRGPYTTLSHCWGGVSLLKLISANYADLVAGFSINDLPKTFLDAIDVALFLGAQYIWIDALTILQDSEEDWAAEASQMGDVYQNSLCNIGATAAQNSRDGLYFTREPKTVNPHRILIEDEWYLLMINEMWVSAVQEAPLNQRGWVVQERWLSLRMLHFGKEQVFWECLTMMACETLPTSVLQENINRDASRNFKADDGTITWKDNGTRRPVSEAHAIYLWRQWDKIVEQYSQAQLSFESDRLIAIAGLATRFTQALGDLYIAGLWKTRFVVHLGWYASKSRRHAAPMKPTRPMEYLAPSWSWASVMNCEVVTPWNGDGPPPITALNEIACLLDYHMEYKSFNTYGQITNGFIKIQGPLHKVALMRTPYSDNTHGYQLVCSDGYIPNTQLLHMDVDEDSDDWSELHFCLILYHMNEEQSVLALLLRQVDGLELCYSRVGLVESTTIWDDRFRRWLLDVERIANLPEETFDPERGYTVKII